LETLISQSYYSKVNLDWLNFNAKNSEISVFLINKAKVKKIHRFFGYIYYMDEIKEILGKVKNIAVIGVKNGTEDDAYKIPYYMSIHGYNIFPVNLKLAGEILFNNPVVAKVNELITPIDLVNIFRNPKYLLAHAQEILLMKPLPKYVWFQLGIYSDEAAGLLEENGIQVVQNRCIMVEHSNL